MNDALTAADVPAEPTVQARAPRCTDHPDAASFAGFGYKGGGYGPYRECMVCGEAFAKTDAKDGNQA